MPKRSEGIDSLPKNDVAFDSKSNDYMNGKVVFAVVSDKELADMVTYLKQYYQLKSDSELLRLCISTLFHQVEPKRKVSVT